MADDQLANLCERVVADMSSMSNLEKLAHLQLGEHGIYEFRRHETVTEEDFHEIVAEAISAAVALRAKDLKFDPGLGWLWIDL